MFLPSLKAIDIPCSKNDINKDPLITFKDQLPMVHIFQNQSHDIKISESLFENGFTNMRTSGDCIELFFWCTRTRDIMFLPSLKTIDILCGKNDINQDPPYNTFQ